MKTNFVRKAAVGLTSGLVFILGCAKPSAQSEQPVTVVVPAPAVIAAPPAPAAPAGVTPAPSSTETNVVMSETNAPAIIQTIPPVTNPENVELSPGLEEVVKLAQAGVSEEVILAYVEKYSGTFSVGADQIVYLNDLGVSGTVITSLLKHDGTTNEVATAPAPALVQTQVVSNVAANQTMEQPIATATAPLENTVAPAPVTTDVAYFYDSLSPYGSWMYVSGYGWCWQPTVAVATPGWRPYSDRGRWYWSDAGWYWNSDYSWGWAPFHYGRWYHHGHRGWLWTPGLVWAPSWVSWRYVDGYCGWAPLPPHAVYRHGVGFTYYGRGVSVGFDFGLSSFHYSFVSVRNFCDYEPRRHYVPHHRTRDFYRNTRVVNNYIVGNNNTVINRGIGRETVARVGGNNIREVAVRERPIQNLAHARTARMDQVERRGNQSVVYRPQLPSTPPPVRTANFANRGERNERGMSTVGRASSGVASGNSGNAQPVTTINRRPVTGGAVVGGSAPATTQPNRRGSEVERNINRREQSSVVRNNGVGGASPVVRETPRANPEPRNQTPQRQPERVGRSLFGESGANAGAPNSPATPSPRSVTPRQNETPRAPQQRSITVPQQQNRSSVVRAEPANPSVSSRVHTGQNQAAPRANTYSPIRQGPSQPAYGRMETRNQNVAPTYSPRAVEQRSAPARPAPSYSPPQSVVRSAPAGGGGAPHSVVRQAPSGGGGGGGGRGGDRGDRGR